MLFARDNKCEYLYPNMDKRKLLEAIEIFANKSSENEEKVMEWIDKVTREGRKDIYIYKFDNNPFVQELLYNDKEVCNLLNQKIGNIKKRHILGNTYDKELKIVRFDISENNLGHAISIYMCKLIYDIDTKLTEMYPIVADIYVDKGLISIKVKTKSNFMEYDEELIELENITLTSPESQAGKAVQYIMGIMGINFSDSSTDDLKYQLYKLLDDCTHTPMEIKQLLDNNISYIEESTDKIINEICKINPVLYDDVRWDITNMLEKYFSMTYPDKKVFTRGRKAYPVIVEAVDQQFSRVRQISALDKPLQSKDIFFDNKKMLQKNQMCESIKFSFQRLDKMYAAEYYSVVITIKRKCCICKFCEYTSEEDIDNVLFSIIGTEG